MSETDWWGQLRDRYPHLFDPRTRSSAAAPRTGDGWHSLIALVLKRISDAVEGHEGATVRITAIGEKYGTLRVDYAVNRVPPAVVEAIENAVAIAEAISEHTCETCGAPGRLYDDAGRFAARCTAHAKGNPLIDNNEEDA
jgi:hypothetical protein